MTGRPQKITFGEMREFRRARLCSDYTIIAAAA
jgi:hypothetical protein